MPIYGYECNTCGQKFEKLVRSSEAAPSCPACGNEDLTRQLSLIAAPAKGGDDAPLPCEAGGGCSPGACRFN